MTVITASPTQFGKLLNLQSEQLSQLKTGTADQLEQLSAIRENTAQAKEQAIQIQANKIAEDTNEKIKDLGESIKKKLSDDAKAITEVAAGMKTFKTIGEKLSDKKQSVKDKFGSLSGILDTFGIVKKDSGGIVSNMLGKRDAQKSFIKEQKMLGSTDSDEVLKQKFSKAQSTSKKIKENEEKINVYKKMGLSEEQIQATPGASLLQNRSALASEYSKHDLKGSLISSDGQSPAEVQEEAARATEEQSNILKQIAENTSPDGKGKPAAAVEKPKEGGGLLDTIMGFLGEGFMSAIKSIFSPKMLFKAISKVFAPLMIIGALVNGIMDGFKEFQETGDIGKALIAGLGGVLEFLTFGLIDKEALSNIIESVSGFVNDYIVQPLSDFFKGVKDNVLALVESIGIPEVKFKIPVINKEVSIGPFYPFKSDSKASAPTAPPPTAAAQVEQQSAENAGAAGGSSGGNSTAVVATNVNNTTKQTNIIKSPVRNQDSTMNRYVNSRYA
jgi:hypothetical protein